MVKVSALKGCFSRHSTFLAGARAPPACGAKAPAAPAIPTPATASSAAAQRTSSAPNSRRTREARHRVSGATALVVSVSLSRGQVSQICVAYALCIPDTTAILWDLST